MSEGIQTGTPEVSGETAQFTWTETRVYSAVVVPLAAVDALLTEHVVDEWNTAMTELLEANKDESDFAPVFAAIGAALIEHVPGWLVEKMAELLEGNADEDSYRPVFAAMAAYAAPGDMEVSEVCDVSAEY